MNDNSTVRYACTECERTFASHFFLRMHLCTVHNIETPRYGAEQAYEELQAVLAATAAKHDELLARREQS